jgi:hypothetical protein
MELRSSRMQRVLTSLALLALLLDGLGAQARAAAAAGPQPNAQGGGNARRPAPIPVGLVRGRYCAFYAPRGWFVRAENAQRVAFGADFNSGDGTIGASYAVFGAGRTISTMLRGVETPDRAVANSLTMSGTKPLRFGNKIQLGPSLFAIEFVSGVMHGAAFYQVFQTGPGDWVIVMREAVTGPQAWRQRAGEAIAVARSVHCNVPNVPARPDPPELTRPSKRAGSGGSEDSLYNWIQDKEYYHDAQGNNYWVSPSQDWSKTGPNGEGYYVAPNANTQEKLRPGFSQ